MFAMFLAVLGNVTAINLLYNNGFWFWDVKHGILCVLRLFNMYNKILKDG